MSDDSEKKRGRRDWLKAVVISLCAIDWFPSKESPTVTYFAEVVPSTGNVADLPFWIVLLLT